MKLSPYMSVEQVCDLLGMSGPGREKRLRRLLCARERQCGGRVKLRAGTGPRARYRLTIPMLRRLCPEFFDARDELAEELREIFSGIDARLGHLEDRAGETDQKTDILRRAVAELQKAFKARSHMATTARRTGL